ncbi:bifunctional diaminohydroxyphosphoribosylaminopyrimidine deaminase/5-amino-6-(5-phosphoribosylamino)uracil reductase RibD [Sphingomonas endophytica]|uniref:Riboflavin biosynthesis protein RibD n=1 Tax=Sphingomonas endophytica TaxID=869719 RepID=A0A147I609_9SPHN|nr:riboflavin biosynthesis protein RibD [Sphingomonas endophytica]
MAAALALASRTRGATTPNPNVGCVIVREGRVVGRGWTQAGGRPHAEAMALAEAGDRAKGATAYVTLEPCAHVSPRGPACADLLAASGVARVVAALGDPDPRTDGTGFARLSEAGIAVSTGVLADEARRSMAGFLIRRALGRPHVTLKLALSLDGAVSMADGRSRWITGPVARAHTHLERSRHDAILVGRGTWETDRPRLNVRLPGLESRSPLRVVLSSKPPLKGEGDRPKGGGGVAPRGNLSSPSTPPSALQAATSPCRGGLIHITHPTAVATLPADHLFVEGGARTAAAFLNAGLIDRLLLYRAPIVIGGGRTLPDIGLGALAEAHGRWRLVDARALGSDRLEVYEAAREA